MARPLFEVFDETEDILTLTDFETEKKERDFEEMLDTAQREQADQKEALEKQYQDGYTAGYEKGYEQGCHDGRVAKEADQLEGINAVINAFHTALEDKSKLIHLNQELATEMLRAVIENCVPALSEATFLQSAEDILHDIAQTATRNVELTLFVHPNDHTFISKVLQSPKLEEYKITLRQSDILERFSFKAEWQAGSGGATFNPMQLTRVFLEKLQLIEQESESSQ